MTIVIAKPSDEQVKRELRAIKAAAKKINATPEKARAFLVKTGFLTKDGKRLHPRYGG